MKVRYSQQDEFESAKFFHERQTRRGAKRVFIFMHSLVADMVTELQLKCTDSISDKTSVGNFLIGEIMVKG